MTIIKLKFSHTPTNPHTHTPTIIHMIVKVYPVESKLQHQQQPFSKCKREYLINFFCTKFRYAFYCFSSCFLCKLCFIFFSFV